MIQDRTFSGRPGNGGLSHNTLLANINGLALQSGPKVLDHSGIIILAWTPLLSAALRWGGKGDHNF